MVHVLVVAAAAALPLRVADFAGTDNGFAGGGWTLAPHAHGGASRAGESSAAGPSPWRWQATLDPTGAPPGWKLGAAVAVHGGVIAVGPSRDWDLGVDQGGVQVFSQRGRRWTRTATIAHPAGDVHARFGGSVALAGDLLLVGAPRDGAVSFEGGAAFVYRRERDRWMPVAALRRASTGADQFGSAVACDDDTLVIGAPRANEGEVDSGAVEVHERGDSGWRLAATLVSVPPRAGALFGASVALDGDRIVVGAPGDRSDGPLAGRAFIFARGAAGWTLERELSCPAGARGWFGHAVAAGAGRVLVGAPRLARRPGGDFDPRGAVFEFVVDDAGWQSGAVLTPTQPQEGDSFGCALAVDGERAVIGASADGRTGRLAGAAFVATRGAGAWTVRRLDAPDAAERQWAGHAVAMHGPRIVVGRLGDQESDPGPGAATVFAEASTVDAEPAPDPSPTRGSSAP